ncbi:hypothetical protein ACP70R_019769 [Stipagrostis hirtigluma subsp. patula]
MHQSTMTTWAVPVPIRRFVDDHQWQAEDLAGRLGIVGHAAFLRGGFVPYGAEPRSGHLLRQVDVIGPSSPSLHRQYYTAPQLVARREDDGPAESVVQEVRAVGAHRGRRGGVAFQACILTRDGDPRLLCMVLLGEDTLAPVLYGGVDEAARALGTDTAGAWLWRLLTDRVCGVLLLDLCRRNDLPVTSFASLPDDVRAEILKRLTDGEDLARVECTSRQLRRLVVERDVELWKPLYEDLQARQSRRWWWRPVVPDGADSSGEGVVSWKARYVKAKQRLRLGMLFSSFDDDWLVPPLPRAEETRVASLRVPLSTTFVVPVFPTDEWQPPARSPEPETVSRGKGAAGRRRKVARNDDKRKPHGAGAVHSPSSRYRWKHR